MQRNQMIGTALLGAVVVLGISAVVYGNDRFKETPAKAAPAPKPTPALVGQAATQTPPVVAPARAPVTAVTTGAITSGRTFQCREGSKVVMNFSNANATFLRRAGGRVHWKVTTPQKTTTFKVDPRRVTCSYIK